MAVRRSEKNLSNISFIPRVDDAIDHEKSDYDAYVKTLDEGKLVFVEGLRPTRFVLNFDLSGKEAAKLKNDMMSGKSDNGEPTVALGSWQQRVTKLCLKAIENPPDLLLGEGLIFRTDENGEVADALLGELERQGIISNIFALYTQHVMTSSRRAAKN